MGWGNLSKCRQSCATSSTNVRAPKSVKWAGFDTVRTKHLYNVACGDMRTSKDANWGASILVARYLHSYYCRSARQALYPLVQLNGASKSVNGPTLGSGGDCSLCNDICVWCWGRPRMLNGPAFLSYGDLTAVNLWKCTQSYATSSTNVRAPKSVMWAGFDTLVGEDQAFVQCCMW